MDTELEERVGDVTGHVGGGAVTSARGSAYVVRCSAVHKMRSAAILLLLWAVAAAKIDELFRARCAASCHQRADKNKVTSYYVLLHFS